jgi:7-carboxy-7-deazaguanine synthase
MAKINLVNNGIFPIIYDKEGNKLPNLPDTGYMTPGTVQGEGKLLGTSCLFIRTSACNLRCAWIGVDGKGSPCDTPYSSHKPEKNILEIEEVVEIIKANKGNISHIVVSGGEPTMQTESLVELLRKLQTIGMHTTIETNATIFDLGISLHTNLVSMSPKLSSSTPWKANLESTGIEFNEKWAERHERDRKNLEVIQSYINFCYEREVDFDSNGNPSSRLTYNKRKLENDFQLKFVITSMKDIEEIENDFLAHLTGVKPSDVCLMPEGVTPEDLMERSGWVSNEAIKRGWRFTPRLHTLMWGTKRGT